MLLFSDSVVSSCLQPHELQYTRFPCPSLSPRVCSSSPPLSQWCHPTISSSVSPFLPAFSLSQHQGLFQSRLSVSGGQSIGASAWASTLPVNIQGWFPLRLTGLISLLSKGNVVGVSFHSFACDYCPSTIVRKTLFFQWIIMPLLSKISWL